MDIPLLTTARRTELAASIRDIVRDLADPSFNHEGKRRIAGILVPLDSQGRPTHPLQELYTRLVRKGSLSKAEAATRLELKAMMEALACVYRHPGPEHVARLQCVADRLARTAAKQDCTAGGADAGVQGERMFPIGVYKGYRLEDDTLRKQRGNGNIVGEKRGGRWYYDWDSVHRRWPQLVPATPPAKPA